jgi:glycosyltransferase involved in cell wall biosynthesis
MSYLIARLKRSHLPASREHAPAAPATCRSVLMVGTDLDGMGGIRAVVQGYIQAGLFERVSCTYVATHRYGPAWGKVWAALAGWSRVAVLLHTLDAPLVHVQLASRASFWRKSVVCTLARLAGRPYLLHVHGAEFHQFYEQESSPAIQRIIRKLLAEAALVIALSEEWRTRLLRICPRARIEVLSNAVSLPDLEDERRADAHRPTLLFLGEVSRRKGIYDLIRALALATERVPRLRLVCGGAGAVEEIRSLAAQLGLTDRVACTGWLDADRKRAELARATIFVLPSYAEGMPMALLEAMSWGLPVLTTPVGGVPQVISHEANGLLVQPGDIEGLAAAIVRLLEAPQLRARLGAAARATIAERFSLDASFERLLEIYRRFGIEPRAATHPRS